MRYSVSAFASLLDGHEKTTQFPLGDASHLAYRSPNISRLSLAGLSEQAPRHSNLIADRCKQIGELRRTRGLLPEPVWYAGLGVVVYAEDGEQYTHEWSTGDNRYTPKETNKKLTQLRRLTGATTCARFQEINAVGCEGCPFKGKINSPIELGYGENNSELEREAPKQAHTTQQEPATQTAREQHDGAQTRKKISATPFEAFDFAKIPPRRWVYGRHYVRKHVTATVGPGGSAKTASKLIEAVSMAIGRDLLDSSKPIDRLRVWYWNGEDPLDEFERRIAAICMYYKIDPRELEGWLFIDSGHDMPICLAAEARGVVIFDPEVVNAINETLERNKIDVFIIDPFISIHKVSENNNPLIDQVVKLLGRIANQNKCAVEIVHHVRKPSAGQNEITADDTRGGGAIVNAVRSCQVLNRMSKTEAQQARIPEDERFRYFRIDSGKQNLAPPEKAKWRYLVSFDLPNGDNVQVVESWKFPEAVNAVTQEEMEFIRATAQAGIDNRWDTRAKHWVGRPLAERLGLDLQNKADREDIKAKLNACRKSGIITIERRQDANRVVREFVVASQATGIARPAG